MTTSFDRESVVSEYRHAGREFHSLLSTLTSEELRLRSNGTRWTNEQLLFHMLFGYLVVRQLLWLVRIVNRLPPPVARDFVNYWGSRAGARVIDRKRMGHVWDKVTTRLLRRLEREPETSLRRSMPYPTRWDPFFAETMTLGDIYHYPSEHFWFHRDQLTAPGAATER